MICPYCSSEQIHAEKRGWKLTTGLIGSRKIIITCLDCGKQFKPGQKAGQRGSFAWVGLLIIFGLTAFYGHCRNEDISTAQKKPIARNAQAIHNEKECNAAGFTWKHGHCTSLN
jgi:hypothetical protein